MTDENTNNPRSPMAQGSQCEELLWAYVDCELESSQVTALELALASDPQLQRQLRDVQAIRSHLRALPHAKAPADFVQRVLEQAERQSLVQSLPAASKNSGRWVQYVAVAAAVLVSVSIGAVITVTLWVTPLDKPVVVNNGQPFLAAPADPLAVAPARPDAEMRNRESQPDGDAGGKAKALAGDSTLLSLRMKAPELAKARDAVAGILADNGIVEGNRDSGQEIMLKKFNTGPDEPVANGDAPVNGYYYFDSSSTHGECVRIVAMVDARRLPIVKEQLDSIGARAERSSYREDLAKMGQLKRATDASMSIGKVEMKDASSHDRAVSSHTGTAAPQPVPESPKSAKAEVTAASVPCMPSGRAGHETELNAAPPATNPAGIPSPRPRPAAGAAERPLAQVEPPCPATPPSVAIADATKDKASETTAPVATTRPAALAETERMQDLAKDMVRLVIVVNQVDPPNAACEAYRTAPDEGAEPVPAR